MTDHAISSSGAARGSATTDEWNYTIVDHGDTSPVAISGGQPAILGNVVCVEEAMAGDPNIDIDDGSTGVLDLPTDMALLDSVTALKGTIFTTDIRAVIASAGSAGKVLVQWKPIR